MPKVDVVNLISYHARKADAPETLNSVSPKAAAERIRESCAEKAGSFDEWCLGILQHCLIPPEHPYRALLKKRKVPEKDALWVLGAIAYGTQSPWIGFRRIVWDDNSVELPDALERKWLMAQGNL